MNIFGKKNNKFKVLFNQWFTEDGGRLYKKRNKGKIIEIPTNHRIKLNKTLSGLLYFKLNNLLLKRIV